MLKLMPIKGVYLINTDVDPLCSSETPNYLFDHDPTREEVWSLLAKEDFIVKNTPKGEEPNSDDWDWDFDSSYFSKVFYREESNAPKA